MRVKISIQWMLASLLALFLALPVQAQDDEGSKRKTKQTVAMSQKVFEKLTEVQELMEAKNYSEGHRLLQELAGDEKLSPYERAQIFNLRGCLLYTSDAADE